MNKEKSLFLEIAEAVDRRISHRKSSTDHPNRQLGYPHRLLRWLTPNGGTLLLVAVLILTQNVWARQAAGPASPGPSATTVNYQGRLANSDGTPLTEEGVAMSFAIYDAKEDGNLIWPADGEEDHVVDVSDGLFSVPLGSETGGGIPTMTWNGDRYLEITVSGETLAPRELIRSVPIAGMALTVPDGAIEGQHLADEFGASNKPLLNFVPITQRQLALRLGNQSDIDWTALDLTNYTSSAATHVFLWVAIHDTDGIATVVFEGNGEEFFRLRNFSTSTWTHDHIMMPMDSTQAIHYQLDAAGTDSADFAIYVIGYWEPINIQ